MTFLPDQYQVPKSSSGYMKFEKGTNRFRILSSAIIGYEYWNLENKPIRSREPWKLLPEDIKPDKYGNMNILHFWAFVAWNYQEKKIQILEITQVKIQRAMKIKIDNRNGDAKGYDFIITQTKEGDRTDYDVDVSEASPLAPEIEVAIKAKPISLEALYDGADPFASGQKAKEHAEVAAIFTPQADDLHGRDKAAAVAAGLPH